MSEQHTKGVLTCTGYVIYADDGTPVANTGLCGSAQANDLGNARRFTACWNALSDLPQDALDGGWTRAGLEAYGNRMKAQRDELLEALKACAAVCAGDSTSKSSLVRALEMARSALEKATGETE